MNCRFCGLPGPPIGYHVSCFVARVDEKTVKDTKTVFYGTHTKETSDEQEKAEEKQEEQRAQFNQEETFKRSRDASQKWEDFFKGSTYNMGADQASGFDFTGFFTKLGDLKPAKVKKKFIQVDMDRVNELLKLCHPDKHGNSEASTEITKWLLDIRKDLIK